MTIKIPLSLMMGWAVKTSKKLADKFDVQQDWEDLRQIALLSMLQTQRNGKATCRKTYFKNAEKAMKAYIKLETKPVTFGGDKSDLLDNYMYVNHGMPEDIPDRIKAKIKAARAAYDARIIYLNENENIPDPTEWASVIKNGEEGEWAEVATFKECFESFAVPHLSPRQKEVYHLRMKGLTQTEVGQLLSITKQTVSEYEKAYIEKAKQILG